MSRLKFLDDPASVLEFYALMIAGGFVVGIFVGLLW